MCYLRKNTTGDLRGALRESKVTAMEFEWDPVKAQSNSKKHGVSFSDPALIFADSNMMTMKDHYDFRGAERGKFYRSLDQLKIPIYLDPEISKDLDNLLGKDKRDLTTIVNDILRKD